jgi:sulfane dehydrogenase subunit SoxC
VQPTRAQFIAQRGELKKAPPVLAFPNQHFNAITSWSVAPTGEVAHAYA